MRIEIRRDSTYSFFLVAESTASSLPLQVTTQRNSSNSKEGGVPTVFIDRHPANTHGPVVELDNRKAGFDATEYLITLGHKRIAIITGIPRVSTSTHREEGYRDALVKHSIQIDNLLIKRSNSRFVARPEKSGTEKGGMESALELLTVNPDLRPTAILATNGPIAGVLS